MSLRNESLTRTSKRPIEKPDRLFTPSRSPSPALSESSTSSSSAPPSREPSVVSSGTSSTSDIEDDEILTPPRQDVLADDTDAFTEHGLHSITDAIRDSESQGQYFPPDHFLAPPTPEQLRRKRKRKPRKSLYTFVRQHQEKSPPKKKVFVDPKIKQQSSVDRSKSLPMISVTIPFKPIPRDEYLINSKEFIPVKVLDRIYKPTVRRRRRRIYKEGDQGIGIGGYIILFADGHEHSVPPLTLRLVLI
jgi:hypothetical protein